mmetsp:Transcript_11608/g.34414  ORF Transcript_11608/g.34414 Transcript_11608/m.34414 type:complete len:264 (-) Transcript_11608:529-1320(-)
MARVQLEALLRQGSEPRVRPPHLALLSHSWQQGLARRQRALARLRRLLSLASCSGGPHAVGPGLTLSLTPLVLAVRAGVSLPSRLEEKACWVSLSTPRWRRQGALRPCHGLAKRVGRALLPSLGRRPGRRRARRGEGGDPCLTPSRAPALRPRQARGTIWTTSSVHPAAKLQIRSRGASRPRPARRFPSPQGTPHPPAALAWLQWPVTGLDTRRMAQWWMPSHRPPRARMCSRRNAQWQQIPSPRRCQTLWQHPWAPRSRQLR